MNVSLMSSSVDNMVPSALVVERLFGDCVLSVEYVGPRRAALSFARHQVPCAGGEVLGSMVAWATLTDAWLSFAASFASFVSHAR